LRSLDFINASFDLSPAPEMLQLTAFNYLMQLLARLTTKHIGFNRITLEMESEEHSLDMTLLESLVQRKGLCLIGLKELELKSMGGRL
jgi:hypothetical protein